MEKKTNGPFLSDRRGFLGVLGAGATLVFPGWLLGSNGLWEPDDLSLTPQQIEGPFYPEKSIEQQMFNDTDLRKKLDDHELARGQAIIVGGVIRNQKGQPLKDSVVEIWQACSSGRYNHSGDRRNPGLLDNNFQFWGRAVTGADGRYSFQSIVPGKYPGRTGRHIHFRVDTFGYRRSTTQCYFSDYGEDNIKDGVYASLNRKERDLVTVEFDKPTAKSAPSKRHDGEKRKTSPLNRQSTPVILPSWKGSFDIVMAAR